MKQEAECFLPSGCAYIVRIFLVHSHTCNKHGSNIDPIYLSGAPDANAQKTMFRRVRQQRERERARRHARITEQRRQAAEKRANNPNVAPCPSCSGTDHSRRTSTLCPHYVPRRQPIQNTTDNPEGQDAPIYLNRKSTIKSSLRSCCDNQPLIQVLQDTVKKCRTFGYVASLFMEFLIVRRLADNEPIPHIDQNFVYGVFCQLIDRGSSAPHWVKNLFRDFSSLVPVNVSQQFYRHTPMITTMAREYCHNLNTDIAMNFEKRTKK
jgi:hypothetical protein